MIKDIRNIFKNDMKAVKNNPVVMVVLLVIILLPSLYALLNIEATWDPYARTSNIEVAVVNEDLVMQPTAPIIMLEICWLMN